MAQEIAIDVSRWQGDIDWPSVTAPIAIIKMTGGDDGLYVDSKANRNYYGAKAAGKAIGMYHFAGGHDAVNEADFFIAACSPLEQDDVMVLDWELNGHPDPVGWCTAFVRRVKERTGVTPMFYTNASRLSADRDAQDRVRYLDWSPVVAEGCGLWVAHYDIDPQGDVPIKWWTWYVMHQYTSTGRMPGIGGNVDINVFFGSVVQFKRYGYAPSDVVPPNVPVPPVVHVPVPEHPATPLPEQPPVVVPPTPDPAPVDTPDPLPTPTPVPGPAPEPVPTPSPEPEPVAPAPVVVVKNSALAVISALAALASALMVWLRT